MEEQNQDELESENQDNGGETVEKQTTETETPDYKKIAEDQKKRAEIAEAKLKDKPKIIEQPKPESQNVDPVEVASLANALQGLTQEEIDFAKTIAAGSKTSLLKALQTEGFKSYHKDIVAEERKKKAALGASRGSGQETQKSMSELSRDEHQKLAMEAAQNIR